MKEKRKKEKKAWTGKKKALVSVASILSFLLLVILLVFIFVGPNLLFSFFGGLKNLEKDQGFDFGRADDTYFEEEDDDSFESIYESHDAKDLNGLLYNWANNGGEKISSKNVTNVLLIGVDSENGLAGGGNTDAIMLVSINRSTKKITIVSVMRDSYVFMDINGKNRYFKINAAYHWGGPATLVKIVEDHYKIEIENYVCVDFSTFPKIIDTLGGVNVEVKPNEARCIKSFFGFSVPTGENVLLDGKSALAFSRIRKCDADGDISRTRRQRSVISAIIEKTREADKSQLSQMLDAIFPNIRTNYSKKEILSLGTQALTNGWADYEIAQITSPSEENRAAATINTHFVWVVDYPLEAQEVQLALYGKTNIVLGPDRVSAIKTLTPKPAPKPTTTSPSTTLDSDNDQEQTNPEDLSEVTLTDDDNDETETNENPDDLFTTDSQVFPSSVPEESSQAS